MLIGQKKFAFFIARIFLFSVFFLFVTEVNAATFELRGKAYWGTYGYIYFHCSEDVTGNFLDEAANLSGAGRFLPPEVAEFHFASEPCTDIVHGVEITDTGVFTGSAWNPSVGLIDFEYDGVNSPPDSFAFNSNCSEPCNASNNCIACYNFTDQKVYGWARVNYNGDWIDLDSNENSVQIQTTVDPIFAGNINVGDFAGTADIPTVTGSYQNSFSFNCLTESYPGAGTCGSRDYRVYIKNLILTNLTAPNWTYNNACDNLGEARRAILRWNRFSGQQTAYEIVVSKVDTLSTSSGQFACWTGKQTSIANQHILYKNVSAECPNGLEYNTPYYWWIRGYDQDGVPTEWVQYDSNSGLSTDQNLDSNHKTFQTFKHEFPNPFFGWTPDPVLTGTTTTFTSASFYSNSASPNSWQSCTPGNCSYLWSSSNPGDTISSSTEPVTDINFFGAGDITVSLQVTDTDGYVCTYSPSIDVNYDLPLWREVKSQ